MKPKIYAAGPIAGQDYDGATTWYEDLRAGLPECDIITPMRGKEWARAVTKFKVADYEVDYNLDELDASVSSDNGIVTRDLWDVSRVDIVFANLLPGDEAQKVSIGTVSEIAIAGFLRIPVVVIRHAKGVHDHPFLRQAAWVTVSHFNTGIQAVRIALSLPPCDILEAEATLSHHTREA